MFYTNCMAYLYLTLSTVSQTVSYTVVQSWRTRRSNPVVSHSEIPPGTVLNTVRISYIIYNIINIMLFKDLFHIYIINLEYSFYLNIFEELLRKSEIRYNSSKICSVAWNLTFNSNSFDLIVILRKRFRSDLLLLVYPHEGHHYLAQAL